MSRNELVWFIGYNSDVKEYEPQRSNRRFTRADISFTDKNQCQIACDRKNNPYERPVSILAVSPLNSTYHVK